MSDAAIGNHAAFAACGVGRSCAREHAAIEGHRARHALGNDRLGQHGGMGRITAGTTS
jgi:hypothetical protein